MKSDVLAVATAERLRFDRFGPAHVEAAANLLLARIEELRADVPCLPSPAGHRLDDLLRGAAVHGVGVAAVENDRLAGYLVGLGVDGLRGPRTAAYVPEWSWAVSADAPPDLFTHLYESVASGWVGRGWLRHLVTALPLGGPIDRQLSWLGFAPCVLDAVRDLGEPMNRQEPDAVEIAAATDADLRQLAELRDLLDDHLGASPTFLHRDTSSAAGTVAGWLHDTDDRVFVARAGLEVVAFVRLAAEGDGVAEIVGGPEVVHVVAACTRPEWRSRGVAEALLASALSDARERGYRVAAVDFETANPLARRFWTRFFNPVCVSYERQLDARLAPVDHDAAWEGNR